LERADRRPHAESGGEAVVHQNDRSTMQCHAGAVGAIKRFTPLEFLGLAFDHGGNLRWRDPEVGNEPFVEHLEAVRRDRPHRELGMRRNAELAHDKHIERSTERSRDFKAHRHSPAGKGQHDRIHGAKFFLDVPSQDLARLLPIAIRFCRVHWCHPGFGRYSPNQHAANPPTLAVADSDTDPARFTVEKVALQLGKAIGLNAISK
jgi:hypothetical protein